MQMGQACGAGVRDSWQGFRGQGAEFGDQGQGSEAGVKGQGPGASFQG